MSKSKNRATSAASARVTTDRGAASSQNRSLPENHPLHEPQREVSAVWPLLILGGMLGLVLLLGWLY